VSEAEAAAAILWLGATLYAVFGGADFGAGFWTLVARDDEEGEKASDLAARAIGPVWEANHVWLIFVLVVLWTSFPPAFSAITSTLFIPLSLAALGIVLRGSGYAFHRLVEQERWRNLTTRVFSLSSLLTPFFMGTAVGAIASERIPLGNATGDPVTSWLNPVSILIGVLFVATGAYLSAVFLIADARRFGEPDMERYFARRAWAAAIATGALAIAGIFEMHEHARYIYDGLTGDALPLVVASLLCGGGVLLMLWRGARRGLRALAIAAVVAVVWAWGVAQYPYLLPQRLKIADGAASDPTLTTVLIVFGIACVVVLPALGLLYSLAQRSMLEGEG
jgi:cytochrome bd ubiquinol oxidase subunit II